MGITNLQDINAIILFNGGTFGDMLKQACIIELNISKNTTIQTTGAVHLNNFNNSFKWITESSSNNILHTLKNKVHNFYPVENTHYFHEEYKSFCNNIFYIEYNNNDNNIIANAYLQKKIFNEDFLLDFTKKQIQERIKIDYNNISTKLLSQYIISNWAKQIKYFRSLNLVPIYIYDLLVHDSFIDTLKRILNKDTLDNYHTIIKLWSSWKNNNEILCNTLLNNFASNTLTAFKHLTNSTVYNIGMDRSHIIKYQFNAQGFRSDINYYNQPSYAFFGCSATLGIGVPYNKTFPSYFKNSYNYGIAIKYTNKDIFDTVSNFIKSKNYSKKTTIIILWCDKNDHYLIPQLIKNLHIPNKIINLKIGYSNTYGLQTLPHNIDDDVSKTHPGIKTHHLWYNVINSIV